MRLFPYWRTEQLRETCDLFFVLPQEMGNACRASSMKELHYLLSQFCPQRTKVEYLTPMAPRPEFNGSLAKANLFWVETQVETQVEHRPATRHRHRQIMVPSFFWPLAYLCSYFCTSGDLPTSTGLRSMDHSCRGCGVSDISGYTRCVCPALNKVIPSKNFLQLALSQCAAVVLIKDCIRTN